MKLLLLHQNKCFTYFEIISVDVGRKKIIFILRLQDDSAVCVCKDAVTKQGFYTPLCVTQTLYSKL